MGWRKEKYQKKKRICHFPRSGELVERDGKDLIEENFVFRPHFFDNYRARVDISGYQKTDEEIARLAVHSFLESELPQKLRREETYQVIVNFHEHKEDERVDLGLFYVPMRKDRFDPSSGRICAVTILYYDERLSLLRDERGLN